MAELFNVFPRFAPTNIADGRRPHVEHSTDCNISHPVCSHFANDGNVFFRKSSLTILRTVMILAAAFLNHIRMIVARRAKKQMSGIYASTVIASVANVQSRIKCTVSQFISKSMGGDGALPASYSKLAIAIGAKGSRPGPAIRGFLDVLYKTIFGGRRTRTGRPFIDTAVPMESLVVHRAIASLLIEHRAVAV